MKKTLIIAALILSTNAFASAKLDEARSKLCAAQATFAVSAAKAAKAGMPLDEFEKLLEGIERKKNFRTAFLTYSDFDEKTIKSLTYQQCIVDLLKEELSNANLR